MEKISIRQAPTAKVGLEDMIKYFKEHSSKPIKECVMVEVGSFVGDSTKIFAKYFKKVICVDPWQNGYDKDDPSSEKWPMSQIESQFDDDVVKNYKNVKKMKMTSIEGAKNFKNTSVDFVYIDGNHLYEPVKDDCRAWLPKIKKTGFIGGHDYDHKRAQGVKPAVDEIVGIPDARFSETSWIKKI